MKEYRLGPPNGEMITQSNNANSSVFSASAPTFFSGITEVGGSATANGPIAFLNPIVLRPEDLVNTPTILEIDAFGFGEGFNGTQANQFGFVVAAETDITKEMPTYVDSAGVKYYPTSTGSRQSAANAADYLLNQTNGVTTLGVSGQRLAFHYKVRICFVTVKSRSSDYATLGYKQISQAEIKYNTSTGVRDASTAGNNTYLPDVADTATTATNATGSNCIAVSAINHTGGLKIALGIVKNSSSLVTAVRFVLSGAVARLYPDPHSSNSTIFDTV